MAYPIWKDRTVELLQGDSVRYRVTTGGNVIFTGKAYRRPGETSIRTRLNDIAADYLSSELPALSNAAFSALSFPLAFDVDILSGGSWVNVDTESFYLDWSYDETFDPSDGLAAPIDGILAPSQWFFYTTMTQAATLPVVITNADGTTITYYAPVTVTPDFNADFNTDFARSLRSAGAGSVTIRLSDYPDAATIEVEGHVYRVQDECRQYVLYYRNAYGGWDSLVVRGTTQRSDTVTRYTRGMVYDNTQQYARGEQDYAVEMVPTFTFHTQPLTDDEASRMHHLLNSPDVYVHDLAADIIRPLVLTNGETPYKTFVSEGRTFFTYEIAARLAQYRERR